MRLDDICEISAGLVLKRKEASHEHEVVKSYKVITLKSFEDDGWINFDYLEDYKSIELLDERYISKQGDVLIRLSNPYTAVYITNEYEGLVIPSLFAILRTDISKVNPGYLSFVLNSETVKQSYFKNSMGITIPVITMRTIRETEIPLQTLAKQSIVSKINELMIKEKKLLQQLSVEKDKLKREISKTILSWGGF
ncbi:MAG: restriction endonuclease subunit S [Gammaproteobacteria bacterium]|jgi:restriction endonuclease S subunit